MTPEPAETAATPRPMREEDLLDLVWIADPQPSPDGRQVAFVRVTVDRAEDDYAAALWLAEWDGGEPRPLTTGPRDRQPRWAPDRRQLAFVRSAEAGKPGQLWLLPMAGGEPRALTSLAGGASSPAWSPDGRRLAFLSGTDTALDTPERKPPKHEPGRVVTKPVFRENDKGFIDREHPQHAWVVEVATGAVRQLTRGPFEVSSPAFARDGAQVRFLCDRRPEPWFGPDVNALCAVPADAAEPVEPASFATVAEFDAGIQAFVEGPGGRIAMLATRASRPPVSYDAPGLWLLDPAAAGAVRGLTEGGEHAWGEQVNSDQHPPRAGGPPPLAWSTDGRAVVARAVHRGEGRLYRVALEGGAPEPLTAAGGDLVEAAATPDGARWAMVIGDPRTPCELWTLAPDAAPRRCWAPNQALLDGLALGEVESFWCDSFDGTRLQCWLVKPPGLDPARRHPLVLEIHGGPHTAYGFGFFHEFHVLAGAGHLVLYVNPRGSTGYGAAFANAIHYDFPLTDSKDLLAAVDHVVARGFVDEARLGVTGGSAGGLLTNWIVTETDRFAAAITQRCVSDWAGMYASCDFAMYWPFWFRRPPHEDRAEWDARSPLARVERIHTPLMIIHSEEDWRTPIAQGEALFRALKQLGRTTVMIRFPGENHELSRSGMPSRRVQNQEHIRAWFGRFLLDQPAPRYGV